MVNNYPDIYFTEEYQQLFKDTEFGGIPEQFTCAGIDYRFYKRPIPRTPYFDIVSLYGYSGPVVIDESGVSQYNKINFNIGLSMYCQTYNIVSEFVRLNPFTNPEYLYTGEIPIKYEHDIYYIDLTQSESDIWKGFDKGCKSAIKKANKKGVKTYQFNGVTGDFAQSYRNYYELKKWGLPYKSIESFIKGLYWRELNLNNQHLAHTFDAVGEYGKYSKGLFLKYGKYYHYFLSVGHDYTNLLLWDSIKWAKSLGYKIFNLGGGLKAGDSLESFKKSFTKTTKPFYTYRKIHNVEVYNKLCKEKGVDPNTENWFPAYRK